MSEKVFPWKNNGVVVNDHYGSSRLLSDGRTCAMVSPPGFGDNNRWGWFAIDKNGKSIGNLNNGEKAPDEASAKRRADETLIIMGFDLLDEVGLQLLEYVDNLESPDDSYEKFIPPHK